MWTKFFVKVKHIYTFKWYLGPDWYDGMGLRKNTLFLNRSAQQIREPIETKQTFVQKVLHFFSFLWLAVERCNLDYPLISWHWNDCKQGNSTKKEIHQFTLIWKDYLSEKYLRRRFLLYYFSLFILQNNQNIYSLFMVCSLYSW